jgi:hypothetical protein
MITDEQLRNAPPHGRLLWFFLWLVPVLKPVLQWPVSFLFGNTTGATLGKVYRLRDKGAFHDAWVMATEAARRVRPKPTSMRSFWWQSMRSLFWWQLVAAGAECVPELGAEERAALEQLLTSAPEPGGLLAAQSYASLARARWSAADPEGAIQAARLAVDADGTWAHGHVQLGWYGLMTRRFDPLPHLHAAIAADSSALGSIRGIPEFAGAPGLLDALLT